MATIMNSRNPLDDSRDDDIRAYRSVQIREIELSQLESGGHTASYEFSVGPDVTLIHADDAPGFGNESVPDELAGPDDVFFISYREIRRLRDGQALKLSGTVSAKYKGESHE